MPRETIGLGAEFVTATDNRADDREQDRRPARPHFRIAIPKQIAAIAVPQDGELRPERIDLDVNIRGTQRDPRTILLICHGAYLLDGVLKDAIIAGIAYPD